MSALALWRVACGGETRLARGPVDTGPVDLLPPGVTVASLLGQGAESFASVVRGQAVEAVPRAARLLTPLDDQDVWASGVTYDRSRAARKEESAGGDCYDAVYVAERPELFLKAPARRVRGPNERVGIRADSTWDVPEPELAIVCDAEGKIAGVTAGNDVSSRSIEGENPLYLPQAKTYRGSCAVGSCLLPVDEAPPLDSLSIQLTVTRADSVVYAGECSTRQMRRSPEELVSWLFRANDFPDGVVLLTGTGVVPPSEFTLRAGDAVTVAIPGVTTLRNVVEVVGR